MENDALLLNMKDTSWDECVTLDRIATDADAEKLRQKGFPLTVSWEKVSALLPEIQPEMMDLSKTGTRYTVLSNLERREFTSISEAIRGQ